MTEEEANKAMAEVEEKAKIFTDAHKGETAEEILAAMRGEEPASDELKEASRKEFPSDTIHGYGRH